MLCMSYQNIPMSSFQYTLESLFIHFTDLSVCHISHDCHQHALAIFLNLSVEFHVDIDGPAHTLNCLIEIAENRQMTKASTDAERDAG